MTEQYRHTPVMFAEVRQALMLKSGDIFVDATLGGAGHSAALAPDLKPEGLLIGIDQDDWALTAATQRMANEQPSIDFKAIKGNFGSLDDLLVEARTPYIDAILFDLGVSSPQLDVTERGFSYSANAPLDMRMDPRTQTLTAAEIINNYNAADLTWILRTFGEEKWASRIAQFIIEARKGKELSNTGELVALIKAAIPQGARRSGGNPAKRSFQALRIAVNQELEVLERGLESATRWLAPGGRIAVISYHSLEDRIVKQFFVKQAQGCICPPSAPICICEQKPILQIATRKPVLPSAREQEANPRSKSAKLRLAVKL